MKKTVLVVVLAALSASAFAQTYVRPHVRKDGTYVEGHYRSRPDNTSINNYSTQGNSNPFTGQQGTVNPYAPSQMPGYIAPMQPIQPIRPLTPFGTQQ